MSELSFMKILLDEVEVKWTPLGDLAEVRSGWGFPNIYQGRHDGTYPFYKVSDMNNTGNELMMGSANNYVNDDVVKRLGVKLAPEGTVIFPKIGAAVATNKKRLLSVLSAYDNNVMGVIAGEKVSSRFLFYWIQTIDLLTLANESGAVPSIRKSEMEAVLAPIPFPENLEKSLEIQAEIVRILDAFTSLTSELITELSARKKQYNYYREFLFSEAELSKVEFRWETLGDVTKKWHSGGTPTAGNPTYYDGGSIPWLRTQEVKFSDIEDTEIKITQAALDNSSTKWIPENCVIVAISGATAGRSAINKIPLTTNQHCGCLEIDDSRALYRYVFHWVSHNCEALRSLGQGARGDLNSSIIKGFKIPIPFAENPTKSISEQARLVAILDKFDIIANSFSQGLPREISLRKKQYEYYRDLLFNLSKPAGMEA